MALKKSVTTAHGFEAVDAYHRIEGVRLVGKDRIRFQVRATKEPGLPHFSDDEFDCSFDMNGANPIAQAYVHLKTLPEFADAVDC